MKKVFAFASVALFAASLTSCTGDFTCSCTYDLNGTATTTDYPYDGVKKSDAEDTCDAQETTWQISDANASCELK